VPLIHPLAIVHQAGALAALEVLGKVQLGTSMAAIGADKPRAAPTQGLAGIIYCHALSGCFPATSACVVLVAYLQRTIDVFDT
jgi:hypothetical protein